MRKLAYFALCLLVFTIPWDNSLEIADLGAISRLVGIIAFTLGILGVLENGRLRVPTRLHVFMIIFVFIAGISLLWTINIQLTMGRLITFLQLLATAWLIWEFAQEQKEQERLFQAYVLGGYVSIIGIFYNYSSLARYFDTTQRYTAMGFSPGELGLTLALGIPMAWFLAVKYQRGFFVWISRLYVPVAVLAIFITGSRGAFFATIGALLIIPWTFERIPLWQKLTFAILIIAISYNIQNLIPASSLLRFQTIQAELEGGGTLSGRTIIWQAGIESFLENPVFGVGAGAFELIPGSLYQAGHNTFLSVLVELGLLGFAVFSTLIVALLWSIKHVSTLERKLWIIIFLAWGIGVQALTWEHRKPTWLIFGILAAAQSLTINEADSLAKRAAPTKYGRANSADS